MENKKTYENNEQTRILCIDCLKGHLKITENNVAICNNCGMKFVITGKNKYKYYDL